MSLPRRHRSFLNRRPRLEVLEDRMLLAATLLADIAPGTLSSAPEQFVTVGNKEYFQATAFVSPGLGGQLVATPTQLWRTDATAAGTALVFDVASAGASTLQNLTAVGNKLFFSSTNSLGQTQIWVSNGTAAGTSVFLTFGGGAGNFAVAGFTSFNGSLYFVETSNVGGQGSALLWKTDGTNQGSQVILNLSAIGTAPTMGNFDVLGNNLLFVTSSASSTSLWRSDGTAGGTFTIFVGPVTGTTLTTAGSLAFFESLDALGNSRLFRTNATAVGTYFVSNFGISNMSVPAAANGRLVFGDNGGVWSTNGATVTLLASNVITNSFVTPAAPGNGVVFFDATDTVGTNAGKTRLWKSDGTVAGTVVVSSTPIAAGGISDGFTLFYFALGTNSNLSLWASDGTTAGTVDLQDFGAIANPFAVNALGLLGSTPVFAAQDSTHGLEPWAFTRSAAAVALTTTTPAYLFPGNAGISLTATLTGPASGTVLFFDSGSLIGSAATSGGVATLTIASPAAGPHVITAAYAGSLTVSSAVSAARGFQVQSTLNPIGVMDGATTALISGWAFDPKLGTSPATVRIVIDGRTYAQIAASTARSDMTGAVGDPNHGFSYAVPNLAAGAHTVQAYVLDSVTHAATLLGSGTISIASAFFNEHYYLAMNPDVAAAVRAGAFASGYQHYLLLGQHEGRNPSAYFDEAYYLATNPDVAAAVRAGVLASGFAHYVAAGQFEGRNPSPYFNESYYLGKNPDAAAAVRAGGFTSGFEHFVLFGQMEGRNPSPYFETAFYSGAFSAAGTAVAAGQYQSVFDYFLEVGNALGQSPLDLFDTSYYLTHNADVATAMTAHKFVSAFDHFMRFGRLEGRQPSALYDEADYLARYPDVRAAVAAHRFDCGLTHFLEFGRSEGRIGT